MPLLSNPTLEQLRLIKNDNLDAIFQPRPGFPAVEGVGLGPRTVNLPTTVGIDIDTTGENTIVIVVSTTGTFIPPFDVLAAQEADGTEISVEPSYVAHGTFRPGAALPTDVSLTGRTSPESFDDLVTRPIDPSSPTARLLVKDASERDQLISGAHIAVKFDKTGFDLEGADAHPKNDPGRIPGTLGCIARTLNTQKLVALTCHHVVIPGEHIFTTVKNAQGQELEGEAITGTFRVVERDGDRVLQVQREGQSTFVDAPTRRSWRKANGQRSDDFIVGQPTPGNCCGLERDEFGRVHTSALTRQVDAAAILLEESGTDNCLFPLALGLSDDLTDWRAEMIGLGGSDAFGTAIVIAGAIPSDLALSDLQQPNPGGVTSHRLSYVVRKYGYKTGLTSGLVRCIEYTHNPERQRPAVVPALLPGEEYPNDDPRPTIPVKQPIPDDFIYVIPFKPTTGEVGEVFAASGDSGSAAVNANGQVVGLVTSGITWDERPLTPNLGFDDIQSGWGASLQKVSNVLQALQVTIVPFDANQMVRTVPEGNADLAPRAARTRQAAPAITALPQPIVLRARRVFPAVRRLVNHNRRVTVAWHRNAGPNLAWNLIRALQDTNYRIPREVNGRASVELLERFLEVLRTECSPSAIDAIDELADLLLQMPGRTISEFAETLKGTSWRL